MCITNRQAIELNNLAIEELKRGSLLNAFMVLSKVTMDINNAKHNFEDNQHKDDAGVMYQFFWEDCSDSLTPKCLPEALLMNDETIPFLYLRFLRITVAESRGVDVDSLCPCGYSWVITYNFGILCTAFGIFVGERGGRLLMQRGFHLLEEVRQRAEAESSSTVSSNWWKLQLSILNNQACIYYECSMQAETSYYLEEIRKKLDSNISAQLSYQDWTGFYLNMEILSRHKCAGTA